MKPTYNQLEAQLREQEAAFAAMREALQDVHASPVYHGHYMNESGERITLSCYPPDCAIAKALSTDAGKAMLERLRKAECLATKHSGDCHWWSYRVCDCGYLMRANSHDFGEPSEQVIADFSEHSANCQQHGIGKQLAQDRLQAVEKAIPPTVEFLQWLDRRGGLGLDVHNMLRDHIDRLKALHPAPQPKDAQ